MMQFLARARAAPVVASNVRALSRVHRATHTLSALSSSAAAASSSSSTLTSSSSALPAARPFLRSVSTRRVGSVAPPVGEAGAAEPVQGEQVEAVDAEIVDAEAEADEDVLDEDFDEDADEDAEAEEDAEVDEYGRSLEVETAELKSTRAAMVAAFKDLSAEEKADLPDDQKQEMEEYIAALDAGREPARHPTVRNWDEEDALELERAEVEAETEGAGAAGEQDQELEGPGPERDEDEFASRGRRRGSPDGEDDDDYKPPLRVHGKRRRGPKEDFPGFIVSVHSKSDPAVARFNLEAEWEADPDGDEMFAEEAEEPGFAERKREEEEKESDPDAKEDPLSEVDEYPLDYHTEFDVDEGWKAQYAHEPDEELVEVIHFFDPMRNKMCSFTVGGAVTPPPFWPPPPRELPGDENGERRKIIIPPGRVWLTWKRSWENLRKYGLEPADEEITDFITDVLGMPKPEGWANLPPLVHARDEEFEPVDTEELEPRPADEFEDFEEEAETKEPLPEFQGRVLPMKYDNVHTQPWQVLKTEKAWQEYVKQGQQPKTWFEEARKQYKKKVSDCSSSGGNERTTEHVHSELRAMLSARTSSHSLFFRSMCSPPSSCTWFA
jgi:hypothetical protein